MAFEIDANQYLEEIYWDDQFYWNIVDNLLELYPNEYLSHDARPTKYRESYLPLWKLRHVEETDKDINNRIAIISNHLFSQIRKMTYSNSDMSELMINHQAVFELWCRTFHELIYNRGQQMSASIEALNNSFIERNLRNNDILRTKIYSVIDRYFPQNSGDKSPMPIFSDGDFIPLHIYDILLKDKLDEELEEISSEIDKYYKEKLVVSLALSRDKTNKKIKGLTGASELTKHRETFNQLWNSERNEETKKNTDCGHKKKCGKCVCEHHKKRIHL